MENQHCISKMKLLITVLLFIAVFHLSFGLEVFEFLGMTTRCHMPVQSDFDVALTIRQTTFNKKAVYGKFNLPFDIHESDQFTLILHRMMEGSLKWEYNFKEIDGDISSLIQKYAKEAWVMFGGMINPNLGPEYAVPKGIYTFQDISIPAEKITIPPGLPGEYLVDLTVDTEDGNILCIQVYGKIQSEALS